MWQPSGRPNTREYSSSAVGNFEESDTVDLKWGR